MIEEELIDESDLSPRCWPNAAMSNGVIGSAARMWPSEIDLDGGFAGENDGDHAATAAHYFSPVGTGFSDAMPLKLISPVSREAGETVWVVDFDVTNACAVRSAPWRVSRMRFHLDD